jgi:hypothetical protein
MNRVTEKHEDDVNREHLSPGPDTENDLRNRLLHGTRFRLRRTAEYFGRADVQVSLSILAILIMIASSVPASELVPPQNSLKTDSSYQPTYTTPYYPYLTNATSYPLPDYLGDTHGKVYFPQITTQYVGNLTVYDLVYVVNVTGVGSLLELTTGSYNASLAQEEFSTNGCQSSSCKQHVPIEWTAPTPIAVFGSGAMIQADAIASYNTCLAVAATVGGETSVFLADGAGGTPAFLPVTGNKPIPGGSPHLMIQNFSIMLTTLNPGLNITLFNNLCPSVMPAPEIPGGFGEPQFVPPIPSVAAVIPFQDSVGNSVTINGTNLSGATQVLFGGNSATFHTSGSQIIATVPNGAGNLPVTVINAYGASFDGCSSLFNYGAALPTGTPQVDSLSPAGGKSGTTVTVTGVYFTHTSTVYFGSTQATASYVSQGVMHATSPSGLTGTLNVTVQNSVGTSSMTCADLYDYQPVVTGLLAAEGASGNSVAVFGSYFTSTSKVNFGSSASTKVTYISSTELKAKVPSGVGLVNVTVTQGNTPSSTVCSDRFLYGSTPLPGTAQILSLSPAAAMTGRLISINGVNFSLSTQVSFGGVPGMVWSVNSSSQLEVQVPVGNGTVPIQVGNGSGLSAPVCEDRFNIKLPPPSRYVFTSTAKEYPSVEAVPFDLNAIGPSVIASNLSNHEIVLYNLTSSSSSQVKFMERSIVPFTPAVGSSIFGTLGGTNTTVTDSSPGQLAVSASGSSIFLFYTTNAGGATVGEVLVSGNGGSTWQGPYFVQGSDGSMMDPQVVAGQSGFIYADFLDGQGTSWSTWQGVFTGSGRVIYTPRELPGSLDSSGLANATLSLALDPLERPIVVWGALVGKSPLIGYSGGFVSPQTELSVLWAGFNDTRAADYQGYGGTGIGLFQTRVQGLFSALESTLSGTGVCPLVELAAGGIYPNITTLDPGFVFIGPKPSGCREAIGVDNSILSQAQVGPLSADVYLSVETETLLESIGYATMPSPSWSWTRGLSGFGNFTPDSNATAVLGNDIVSANATTLNPNTVWLHVTSYLGQTNESIKQLWYNVSGVDTYCGTNTTSFQAVDFYTNLTVGAQGVPHWYWWNQSYWYPSKLLSPYITNLTPLRNGTWIIHAKILLNETADTVVNVSQSACSGFRDFDGGVPTGRSGTWPGSPSFTLTGTFTTGLSQYPIPSGLTSPFVDSYANLNNTDDDQVIWNNTILAHAEAWINSSGLGVHYPWSNSSNAVLEQAHGGHWAYLTPNAQYSLAAIVQTSTGGTNGSWGPVLDTSEVSQASVPITTRFSCPTFTQEYNPVRVWWFGTSGPWGTANITNLSATSATITWYSTGQGTGYVTGSDYPENDTIDQTAGSYLQSNGTYQYVVQLHGLDTWGAYRLHMHLTQTDGCVLYVASSFSSYWTLQLPGEFPISETDNIYDSITQSGGGARITWQVPYNFTTIAAFQNATLVYCPTNHTSEVNSVSLLTLLPIATESTSWLGGGKATSYGINLSATTLNPNWTYEATMFLNYTLPVWGGVQNGNFLAWSYPYTFTYLRDTSGDGLSDAEKSQGWNVVVDGKYVNRTFGVAADWATNGLVSDYVEKEYGLNATTLDTAQSGMLDTWNLTFSLGLSKYAPVCPRYINCWYANSTDPFNSAPYPGGAAIGSGYTVNQNGARHGPLDDSNYTDANILWEGSGTAVNVSDYNNSALGYLQSLIANNTYLDWGSRYGTNYAYIGSDPLRAVVGCIAGSGGCGQRSNDWTLTVWGKLSWGANPLNTSTPDDGIPDGARISPLTGTGLNLTVTGWSESLSTGDGVAAYLLVSSPGAPYWHQTTDYSGYSISENDAGFSGEYTENFQVAPTQQYAKLNFSLDYQGSSGGVTSICSSSKFAADLFNPQQQSVSCINGPDKLYINYQTYPIQSKNPSFIVVPMGNSTLSALPLGLTRYTGEQDFELIEVEVNSTLTKGPTSFSLGSIGYPAVGARNGVRGAYGITFQNGLTNVLIPRMLFLDSPFGQAVLNNTNESILPTTEDAGVQPAWTAGIVAAKSIGGNYTNSTGKTSFGPVNGSSFIKVYTPSSQSCSIWDSDEHLCGGVPGNAGLEAGNQTLAVGGVIVLNLTNQSNFEALIAGLLLNHSGNVTARMWLATPYLDSLGLPSAVLNVLSDYAQFSSGTYGAPIYTTSSSSSGILSGWEGIWNSNFGWLGSDITATWNWLTAGLDYLYNLGAGLVNWALSAAKQDLAGLEAIASAALNLLEKLWDWVIYEITQEISVIVSSIKAAFANYDSALSAALNASVGDVYNGGGNNGHVTNAHALQLISALGGSALILALALGVIVAIVFYILTPLELGSSFLLGVIVAAFGFTTLAAVAGLAGAMVLTAAGIGILDSYITSLWSANSGTIQQTDWGAVSGAIGGATSFVDIPLASYLGDTEATLTVTISEDDAGNPVATSAVATSWSTIAFAFDILALIALVYSWSDSSLPVAIIASALGGVALITSAAAAADAWDENPEDQVYMALDLILSGISLGTSVRDVGADV